MPRQYTPRVARECEHCHAEFLTPPNRLKTGRARFCGRPCYTASGFKPLLRLPAADRFWSKVDKNGPIPEHRPKLGPCWLWTAGQTHGYGQFNDGERRAVKASRVALELALGWRLPTHYGALHACDNTLCVRNDEPDIYVIRGIARPRFGHLWAGSHRDNMADMAEKGRAYVPWL